MARARSLKPGFFKNADLLELPFEARLLFAGLWTLADRNGRLEDKPKQIKIEIFPGDNVDCDALLCKLDAIHMVARYQHSGNKYIQITNFAKHQNPHRDERPSLIPENATDSVATNAEPEPKQDAAPYQNKASTVQAQCDNTGNTVVIGLTPDSYNLTPDSPFLDSLNLTPDCSTKTQTPSLPRETANEPTGATRQSAVCVVLKSEGIAQVNPSHPDLLELLEAGAQLTDFVAACEIASGANKPHFGYVLGIVRRRLEDAKKPAKHWAKNSSKAEREVQSFKERDERLMRKNWEAQTGRIHPDNAAEMAAENADKATPLEALEFQTAVTKKTAIATAWQPATARRGVHA